MDDNHGLKNGLDDYREETSAEFVDSTSYNRKAAGETMGSGAVWSYVGILFAVLSMFWMPTTFAIMGIILGIVGFAKKSSALGVTAIIIGLASLFMQYFWTSFNWF